MRSIVKRALPLAIAGAVGLTGLVAAPAHADKCETSVFIGGQRIGVDSPAEGMTGVIYLCLEGIVNFAGGAGVWVHQETDGLHIDPVICTGGTCRPIL